MEYFAQLNESQTIALLVTISIALFGCFYLLIPDLEAIVDFNVPIPEQCQPEWKGQELDEPSLKVPSSSAIQCYCPANGRSLGLINPTTAGGIDRAIVKAKEAQVEWAKTGFSQRRRVLKTLLKFILDNQDTIARVACLDSGKTMVDACFGEILVTIEKLKWTIDHGEKALKPERRPTNLLMCYKVNEVRWEPLGVVAACVSWNYPFHNLIGPCISALFTGNAIIVKGSEATAWSSNYYTTIIRNALTACGHSPSLVSSVTCWPATASYLTSHPLISHLTFIGSRPVAHAVCASAAKSLTPVCVELGGKDPAILLDDVANLPRVANILLRGVFQSAGQNCIGIERIICLPTIYPRLITHITPLIRSLRQGSALDSPAAKPIDIGASISPANFPHIESLISEAVAQGARLLAGGKQHHHPDHPKGHYFAPTLLVDVKKEMRIAQTELFAPVFLVLPADNLTHAIDIANSTSYALGASVFGSDPAALDRVVDEVHAGMVAVNDFAAFYAVQLPFGGVKGSGYGRFAGEEGLRGLCNIKAVCRDRFGWVGTSIPGPLCYPIGSAGRAWEMCRGVVEVGYGESLGRRWGGLRRLIGL
ncbi:aldehyde dehydrogenase [Patellaria atrata CBS 101060]|uniref:aldehyde dehydrogenase (NAD(+)) n=1 Tax=Patellaria atrata CBS 101060 TaxID=1346257 RepID=A0A9P4SE00_9PEZI|nr:aldehyde dehydrogenase [Patellaria atrata CBS 101060]